MHTVNLIAKSLRHSGEALEIKSPLEPGVCCLTGDECMTIPRSDIISSAFTAQSLFNAPQSDRIGVDAALALSYKWERMSCWYVTKNEFRRIQKPEARQIIFERQYPAEPWAGYITTSYKKHGALTTPANMDKRIIWGFNEDTVDLTDHAAVTAIYERLLECKKRHLPQLLMTHLTLDYAAPENIIFVSDFINWARPLYKSSLYQFLMWLLPPSSEVKK